MRYLGSMLLTMLVAAVPAASVLAAPPAVPPGLEFRHAGYFEVRHDMRKCPSPVCGGFWLKRVNQPFTVCADGQKRAQCYVAELEGAPETLCEVDAAVLVRGSLRPRVYTGVGADGLNLGFFRVAAAWRAAAPGAPEDVAPRRLHYAGIESSGIVCITTPCPSFTEYTLNSPRQRLLADVDLSPAGARPEVEQKALNVVAAGEVLLVRGLTREDEASGTLYFEARQFYLPVR